MKNHSESAPKSVEGIQKALDEARKLKSRSDIIWVGCAAATVLGILALTLAVGLGVGSPLLVAHLPTMMFNASVIKGLFIGGIIGFIAGLVGNIGESSTNVGLEYTIFELEDELKKKQAAP